MTKKDFELIAQVLRESRPRKDYYVSLSATVAERETQVKHFERAYAAWDRVVKKVMDALKAANPRFDTSRFFAAVTRQ